MRTQRVDLGTEVHVDTSDFNNFAKALRKADRALYREMAERLRHAGDVVKDSAIAKAAEHSHKIPPTIRTRVSGASVSVVAGVGGLPLAALFELGNKRSTGDGYFRHPVFGGDAWVSQAMHPYLRPAFNEHIDEAVEDVAEALDWAIAVACTDDGGS